MNYEMLTKEEWNLLDALDDAIMSGGCNDMSAFLESLTAEEEKAMVKWLNRNTDKNYTYEEKDIIVNDYIKVNTMEAVSCNIDTVAKMIKLWQFAVDNS